MKKLTKRSEKDAFLRIFGSGNKIKGILQDIILRLNRIPKVALDQWKKYIQLIAHKKILDNLKSEKLKSKLLNISKRKTRDAYQRIIGEGNKIKGALRRIAMSINKRSGCGFDLWKKFVEGCKQKSFFDANRSARLKNTLNKMPLRTVKGVFNRIIGSGNAISGRLSTIFSTIEKLPQTAFKRWVSFISEQRHKNTYDLMRSHRVKSALFSITKRTLSSVFKNFDKHKLIVAKKCLKDMIRAFTSKPKAALSKWVEYVKNCKEKKILDMIRYHKLLRSLTSITLKTTRDSYQRIIGGGDKVKGKIESLFDSIAKLPRIGFNKWKNFVAEVKTKGLLDNIKSFKLRNAMERLVRRTIRGSTEIIIGHGSIVAGALRRLSVQIEKKGKFAFENWKKYVSSVKNKSIFDNRRAHMVKFVVERLTRRTFKTTFERVVGNGSFVNANLRRLAIQLNKSLESSFSR